MLMCSLCIKMVLNFDLCCFFALVHIEPYTVKKKQVEIILKSLVIVCIRKSLL